MLQKIQTCILVTIITVLIWLYAESENRKVDKLYPDIEFVAPVGRQLLIEPREPPTPVAVTVRGSTAQLGKLRREIAQPVRIELIEDSAGNNPLREVNLVEVLSKHPRFALLGINVEEATPPRVTVRVERIVPRTLPIEAPAPGDFLFNETPIVAPTQATVRMPESDWTAVPPGATLVARLDVKDLAQREVNKQQVIVNVPLVLPQARLDRAVISPNGVTVTLTIKQKNQVSTPQLIPIMIVAPIKELQSYEVQIEGEPVIRGVLLRGPNEVIDQINRKEVKLGAELRLSAEDLDKAVSKDPVPANLYLNLPKDVQPVELPPPVKYKVIKRTAAPATP